MCLTHQQFVTKLPDGSLDIDDLTVAEHLAFYATVYRVDDAHAKADRLLQQFELDQRRNTQARDLSRGMRQKLGIIMALAHDPELLILDEPTTALDPLIQGQLMNILRSRAGNGVTVFFSSHVLGEVSELCDRVGIIRGGCLVADEPLALLRRQARRQLVLSWKEEPQQVPDFLTVQERGDLCWRCSMDGPAEPLLAWLRDKPVTDMTLGEPDLDHLFRTYYQEDTP